MALQRVASAAVLWLLVVAQVVVAGRYYLPQDEANSFVQDTGNDCGGDNWKHNFRCIPPMRKTASAAENVKNSDYVIDNRPFDFTGSDCGPLGKHKYRCVPPMDTTSAAFESAAFVEVDNRPFDFTGSDCGPLGKHKYRCVPPMDIDTSASSMDTSEAASTSVQGTIDHTGKDCGDKWKHFFPCIPPKKSSTSSADNDESNSDMDTSRFSSHAKRWVDTLPAHVEVDNRPVDYTGSDCGPLGKHKYRCVPPP